jgi:hypothetical protein
MEFISVVDKDDGYTIFKILYYSHHLIYKVEIVGLFIYVCLLIARESIQ